MDAMKSNICICCGKPADVTVYPIKDYSVGDIPMGIQGTRQPPKYYCDPCYLKNSWWNEK